MGPQLRVKERNDGLEVAGDEVAGNLGQLREHPIQQLRQLKTGEEGIKVYLIDCFFDADLLGARSETKSVDSVASQPVS